jgi:hypothetical protein
MPGKSRAALIILISVLLVTSYMGVTYACFGSPDIIHLWNWGDLKIRDQDESWKDGVFATWTARNIAPGHVYSFTGSYVGLKTYLVNPSLPAKVNITCKYNPWSSKTPDAMANYLTITNCTYNYSYLGQSWQIDFLTGITTRLSPSSSRPSSPNIGWKITDADSDGFITFHDLKMRPLTSVPIYSNNEADFKLTVRFDKAAGDKFQKSVFNLEMVYSLVSQ